MAQLPDLMALIEPNQVPSAESPTKPAEAQAEVVEEAETETVLSHPETESPGETPEEEGAETEGEPPSAPSDAKEGEPTEQEARFQKRINKEVAKRKALEEELTRLKAGQTAKSAEEPKAVTPTVDLAAKLPEVEAAAKAEREAAGIVSTARTLLRQLTHDPDAALRVLAEQVKVNFTEPEQAREWLEDQRDAAVQQVAVQAARRETLVVAGRERLAQQQAANDAEAVVEYPWHADKESAQWKLANQIVAGEPALMQRPDRLLILGALVEGMMARQARKSLTAKKAAPGKASPPRLPGAPSHTPTMPNAERASRQGIRERAWKDPSDKEASGALLSSLMEK